MTKQTIIHELNEKAISDGYLYKLLEKIQYKYGVELLSETAVSLTDREFLNVLRFAGHTVRTGTWRLLRASSGNARTRACRAPGGECADESGCPCWASSIHADPPVGRRR